MEKKLWDSGPVKPGDPVRKIYLDVTGIDELELIFDATHFDYAQGAWAQARLSFDGPAPVAMEIPAREKYILTPSLSDEPQINGLAVFGVRPGHPVLYKIPASGKKPISYSVRNLPKGLSLDKKTGVISGHVEEAGDYKLTLLAKKQSWQNTAGVYFVYWRNDMPDTSDGLEFLELLGRKCG